MNKHTAVLANGNTVTRNSATRIYGFAVDINQTAANRIAILEYQLAQPNANEDKAEERNEELTELHQMAPTDIVASGVNCWTTNERTGQDAIRKANKVYGPGAASLVPAVVNAPEQLPIVEEVTEEAPVTAAAPEAPATEETAAATPGDDSWAEADGTKWERTEFADGSQLLKRTKLVNRGGKQVWRNRIWANEVDGKARKITATAAKAALAAGSFTAAK